MTIHAPQTPEKSLEAELDRLTYSAYLLRLDPGKAFSAVASAIDGSLEETTPNSDLLERTAKLALEQVLCESGARWDGESSAYDVVLSGRWFSSIFNWATNRKRAARGGPAIAPRFGAWGAERKRRAEKNPGCGTSVAKWRGRGRDWDL